MILGIFFQSFFRHFFFFNKAEGNLFDLNLKNIDFYVPFWHSSILAL